jgi:hypothetical protein
VVFQCVYPMSVWMAPTRSFLEVPTALSRSSRNPLSRYTLVSVSLWDFMLFKLYLIDTQMPLTCQIPTFYISNSAIDKESFKGQRNLVFSTEHEI